MVAKDIMRRRLVAASPEMTMRELATLFIEHGITGAPVVAADGKLVGVVSQTDMVRHDREAPTAEAPPSFYREPEPSSLPRGFRVEAPDFTRVREIMTPAVLSVAQDASVEEIARLMLRKRVHRVIVTRDGKPRGIVTTMDLLRALLDLVSKAPSGGQPV